MPLLLQPGEVVVAHHLEVEAGLLGSGRVVHQLPGCELLGHQGVAVPGHRFSSGCDMEYDALLPGRAGRDACGAATRRSRGPSSATAASSGLSDRRCGTLSACRPTELPRPPTCSASATTRCGAGSTADACPQLPAPTDAPRCAVRTSPGSPRSWRRPPPTGSPTPPGPARSVPATGCAASSPRSSATR